MERILEIVDEIEMINWIKCSERMPSDDREVLVYDKEFPGAWLASYYKDRPFDKRWESTESSIDLSCDIITHWAEINEPIDDPKECREAFNDPTKGQVLIYNPYLDAINVEERLKKLEAKCELLQDPTMIGMSALPGEETLMNFDIFNKKIMALETAVGGHIDKISHCEDGIEKCFEKIESMHKDSVRSILRLGLNDSPGLESLHKLETEMRGHAARLGLEIAGALKLIRENNNMFIEYTRLEQMRTRS